MHFAYYLYGSVFRVVTDHKGLTKFCSGRQCNRRIYRWSLKLAEFQFTVEYRKGAENGVADCLSRCFGADEDEKDLEQTSSSEVVTHLSKRGEMWAWNPPPHFQELRTLDIYVTIYFVWFVSCVCHVSASAIKVMHSQSFF